MAKKIKKKSRDHERVAFLNKLRLVAPALSDSDLIPALRHFWFTGETLMAFNDRIAISTPFATNFQGAIAGDILLNMMGASRGGIEFNQAGETLEVRVGPSRMKFHLLPPESFVFEMPVPDAAKAFPVGKQFLESVSTCMLSVSLDTSVPDQLGVTLIPNGKEVLLFTTNNSTLTHARVPLMKATTINRVILPTQFCEEMLKLAKKDLQLEIYDDHALFVSGDTILFGRLIESSKPLDFPNLLKRNFPDERRKQLIAMPDHMKLALKRAVIITESRVDKTKTAVTVNAENKLKFMSKSERGELSDTIRLKEDHAEVSVMINPKLLEAAHPQFDKILITERCIAMSKGGATHLVAATED